MVYGKTAVAGSLALRTFVEVADAREDTEELRLLLDGVHALTFEMSVLRRFAEKHGPGGKAVCRSCIAAVTTTDFLFVSSISQQGRTQPS